MRTRLARLLRRGANRLDPSPYYGNVLIPNEWNHVTASTSVDGGSWRIWINGERAS
jgi:hypothetical protein